MEKWTAIERAGDLIIRKQEGIMKENRVFSEEEIRELEGRTLDRVLEAMDAGETDKAKELCNRMYNEFLFMHDTYMYMVAGLMSEIYRQFGADKLEEIERGAFRFEGMVAKMNKKSLRDRVLWMINSFKGHLQSITIEEDDEKIILTMHPCGSGQRLVEQGAYGPPANLATIKEPHPIGWGKRDFPIYCTHDPVLEMVSIEQTGYPPYVCFEAEPMATGPCRVAFYKDPRDIPVEFFTRLGKKKPKLE